MIVNKLMLMLGAAALVVSAPACDQNKNKKPKIPGTTPATTTATEPTPLPPGTDDRNLDDAEITRAVDRELLFAGLIDATAVKVDTKQGIVELTGTVDNMLAKQRATEIARTVKGVLSVSNRIDVKAVDRPDDELESAVEGALLRDPAADSYEVKVKASDGVVTLTGTVDSWHEKQLSEQIALRVRGVEKIDNQIDIEYTTNRTDPELASDVASSLEWDALVDHRLIDVRVDNGTVFLTGTVGSAAEKTRAISDAWVTGTKMVNGSGLKIEWWAEDPNKRKLPFVSKPDAEIAEAVKRAALYDPRVLSFNVVPTVSHGVVTLHGTVDNMKAKQAAERLARNTTGVIAVRNNLNVAPPAPIADSAVAGFIDAGLARSPITESYEIDVAVDHGIATLRGTVDSFAEKAEAEDVALRTTGVLGVINQLEVTSPAHALVFDDLIDGPDVIDWMIYVPGSTELADDAIKSAIETEILWDPDVDSWQVKVEVEDGTATLTGQVDSYYERREATANALEGGAVAVVNQLAVAR
jgi:osmotically-inducible protein OsmY